jgi:segregation and condensation protein A
MPPQPPTPPRRPLGRGPGTAPAERGAAPPPDAVDAADTAAPAVLPPAEPGTPAGVPPQGGQAPVPAQHAPAQHVPVEHAPVEQEPDRQAPAAADAPAPAAEARAPAVEAPVPVREAPSTAVEPPGSVPGPEPPEEAATEPPEPTDGTPADDAPADDAPADDAPADDAPADDAPAVDTEGGFRVRLDNFEGPFDLLLQLISKHKLDVTEVALSKVTDEFIAHIRAMGPDWDLDQATGFLVVAATLLDLKAARLLPAAEVEDEEDLALLEARDLLFARLLQYRAYKQIAAIFAARWAEELRHHPRTVGLEPHHADLLPDVVISIGPEGFARLAAKAMVPKPKPAVYVEHIHAPLVSVREQAEIVVARLRDLGRADFRTLTEDAADTLTVVARFLALLELYREKAVALDQDEALGELVVRWTGDDAHQPVVTDEFDQETQRPEKDGTR